MKPINWQIRLAAVLSLMLCLVFCLSVAGAESRYAGMTAEEITAQLTLEQKASQMVQPACYNINSLRMQENCYGSLLSQSAHLDARDWRGFTARFQRAALESEAGVPFIYGQDDVHGVNYCVGAVLFPHNIGLGAADDEDLMYRIGRITADEAKLCHMLWNFAPVVAQASDLRWGRTYECYGSDLELIKRLSTAYTRGLVDGGIVACPKHFFGDGNTVFGTGESSDVQRLLDRGDAQLTDAEIAQLLSVYQAQIEAGAQTIMVSFSSLNGVKMHENRKYLDYLKNEMGFKGYLISDWNAVQQLSPDTYYGQIVAAVNAGLDMLMEVDTFNEARDIIVRAMLDGDIPEERVDDAVRRIIQVKIDAGIMDDPLCENLQTEQEETGSPEYRAVAEEAVEKSLVLLKNEGNILPFRPGTTVYITGPAADDPRVQCGGWSIDWTGSPNRTITGATSILEGFMQTADAYGIRIITDEAEADQADVVLLAVGESTYAEWTGDTDNPDLCGKKGLRGNEEAITMAAALGKPVVTCIVAGRQVFIKDYIDQWDAAVMCYLPGSEGRGVANVLCGKKPFSGKLPSPWYSSVDQIGTEDFWLPAGYGLTAE